MRTFLFLLIVFGIMPNMFAQSVVFIEKNGMTYSDTTSTPAINILTGEFVRANDLTKDTLEFKKGTDGTPSNQENSLNRPHDYIIEPKKKE